MRRPASEIRCIAGLTARMTSADGSAPILKIAGVPVSSGKPGAVQSPGRARFNLCAVAPTPEVAWLR